MNLIKDTKFTLISISGKVFTTSLTLWLSHPCHVWLEVTKVLDVHIVSQFCCRLHVLPSEVRTVKLKQFLPDTLMGTVKVGQIWMEWTIGLLFFWQCTSVYITPFLLLPSCQIRDSLVFPRILSYRLKMCHSQELWASFFCLGSWKQSKLCSVAAIVDLFLSRLCPGAG